MHSVAEFASSSRRLSSPAVGAINHVIRRQSERSHPCRFGCRQRSSHLLIFELLFHGPNGLLFSQHLILEFPCQSLISGHARPYTSICGRHRDCDDLRGILSLLRLSSLLTSCVSPHAFRRRRGCQSQTDLVIQIMVSLLHPHYLLLLLSLSLLHLSYLLCLFLNCQLVRSCVRSLTNLGKT